MENLEPTLAREIMKSPVFAIQSGTSVARAASLLVQRRIGGAPVIDRHGLPIGVVSVFDIAAFEGGEKRPKNAFYSLPTGTNGHGQEQGNPINRILYRALHGTSIDEIMTRRLIGVAPDEPLATVARLMLRCHIHRVLVLDKGSVVGLISTMDILEELAGRPASVL